MTGKSGIDALSFEPADGARPPDDSTARRATFNFVMTERTRTIDQIKRLYAVVMGLAVSTCFSNTYQCVKMLNEFDIERLSVLFSQFVAFLSLVVLFYLGSERMLDARYLGRESRPATRRGLFFDLIALGTLAACFVVLADSMPDKDDFLKYTSQDILPSHAESTAFLLRRQHTFVKNLVVLYALDVLILLVQILALTTSRSRNRGSHDESVVAHWWWVVGNLFCLLVFTAAPVGLFEIPGLTSSYEIYSRDIGPNLGIGLTSFVMVTVHVVRFFLDYMLAFKFYYSQEKLPKSDDLFFRESAPDH